jgi:5-methylcytosine-specific restriction protein A
VEKLHRGPFPGLVFLRLTSACYPSWVAYEWCITSDSEHNPGGDWPYRCRVEYLRAFEPPITLRELCAVAPERDWNAPHRNMRVKAATIIPGFIAEAVRSLRPPSLTELDRGFFKDVEASMRAPTEKRRARLAAAARYPRKRRVTVEIYCRNPDVVAEVLMRANGLCERCERPAPFLRLSDGSPYLESHHTIRLADEGPDTVENTVALCPNCHRETHYGRPRLRS